MLEIVPWPPDMVAALTRVARGLTVARTVADVGQLRTELRVIAAVLWQDATSQEHDSLVEHVLSSHDWAFPASPPPAPQHPVDPPAIATSTSAVTAATVVDGERVGSTTKKAPAKKAPAKKAPAKKAPAKKAPAKKAPAKPHRLLHGHRKAVRSMAFGAIGGRLILATGSDDQTVRVWDSASGRSLATLEGHGGVVRSVAFGATGGRLILATGGDDQTVRLWDPDAWDPASGIPHLAALLVHDGPVTAVAFGELGSARHPLLATGSADGTARLWDPDTARQLRALIGHDGSVTSVVCGELASARWPLVATGSADGTLRLWRADTGQHLRTLGGHGGPVTSVAFGTTNAGQPIIAAGSDDRKARLWDPDTGRRLRNLRGHTGAVTSVAIGSARDGRALVATGSDDETVRMWDLDTGQPLSPLTEDNIDSVTSVAWAAPHKRRSQWVDGARPGVDKPGQADLAAGHQGGTVTLWRV